MMSRPAATSLAAVGSREGVLLAVPAARLLLDDDPSLYPGLVEAVRSLSRTARGWQATPDRPLPRLTDPSGHGRSVYWLLAVHLCVTAFGRCYEKLSPGLWGACEEGLQEAVAPARWVEQYTSEPPPADRTAEALWSALCLLGQAGLASRDADIEWVEAVVHSVVKRPGPDGSLHPRIDAAGGGEVALDTWTYRELCGLHALANLALLRRNRAWASRVEQVAMHHLENTQPDHATGQPWGLFAFLWSSRTRGFGEQQLHDAAVLDGGAGSNAVTGMLLADAAAALTVLDG